jgi:hypothetical protein
MLRCGVAKIFCVGSGKTGTSSWAGFMRMLGFSVGDQRAGEALLPAWSQREFTPILRLAETADAFQDFPFNAPFTFQALDTAFPDAKFILTTRDPESWYESLVAFHSRLFGNGRLPTADDLRAADYVRPGWVLDAMKAVYGISDDAPYDRTTLIGAFERYNKNVLQYFSNRPDSLLTIDLREPDAAERIALFCGTRYAGQRLPHFKKRKPLVPATIG